MSTEHNFTMTDRQKKRDAVEKYNQKYEAAKLEREARQQAAFGGQLHLENIPHSNTPIEVSYRVDDKKEPIPGSVVVKQDEEEIPVVEDPQSDGTGRRVAVLLGAGGFTPTGRAASRLIRDMALQRAVGIIQEQEAPKKSIALVTKEVIGELGKQQAREDICRLLIEEGDNKQFTDYLATLSGIKATDVPLRKLKLRSLKDVDPKEIMVYAELYRQVIQEVYGVDENGKANPR